jgi:hypothetical protein
MPYSVAPLIYGFKHFDKRLKIKGVIFNQVNTASHYPFLKQACQDVGLEIPKNDQLQIPQNDTESRSFFPVFPWKSGMTRCSNAPSCNISSSQTEQNYQLFIR